MPAQTHTDHAQPEELRSEQVPAQRGDEHAPEPRSPLSRRSVLRGAAGAGAIGLAAAAGANAFAAATRPSAEPAPTSRPATLAAVPPTAMAGPFVVYISDTTTGQFDVFGGTGQVRVRNPALVRQLLAHLRLA